MVSTVYRAEYFFNDIRRLDRDCFLDQGPFRSGYFYERDYGGVDWVSGLISILPSFYGRYRRHGSCFTAGAVALLTNTELLFADYRHHSVDGVGFGHYPNYFQKVRKKKIFPSTPIHHTFEAMGWPETQITMRFWMINAIGAVIGLILFFD